MVTTRPAQDDCKGNYIQSYPRGRETIPHDVEKSGVGARLGLPCHLIESPAGTLHLDEQAYRFNTRKATDHRRFFAPSVGSQLDERHLQAAYWQATSTTREEWWRL